MTPGDRTHLEHIVDQAALISASVAAGRAAFMASRLEQHATTYRLQTMAESAQRLPESLKADHPEIPWREIAGLRNRAAHGYLHVDPEIIWSIASHDVQPLASFAVTELARDRQLVPDATRRRRVGPDLGL